MVSPLLSRAYLAGLIVSTAIGGSQPAFAAPRQGTASWYSYESARREGNSGVMANGEKMQDTAFTVASYDYALGRTIRVCLSRRPTVGTGDGRARPCVEAVVTDRGPARRLYRRGRILDLSKASFQALAPLSQGVIPITVEELP